jgi:septal ring factor EnvC (AmiA/AmiB activator)
MNTPASAVPSREAVEELVAHLESVAWRPDANGDPDCYDEGQARAADMLRTLLAEVERLTDELGYETTATQELAKQIKTLNTTVADQAAALAERDKDAERYRCWRKQHVDAINSLNTTIDPPSHTVTEQQWDERIDAALAASVSSASEDCSNE